MVPVVIMVVLSNGWTAGQVVVSVHDGVLYQIVRVKSHRYNKRTHQAMHLMENRDGIGTLSFKRHGVRQLILCRVVDSDKPVPS